MIFATHTQNASTYGFKPLTIALVIAIEILGDCAFLYTAKIVWYEEMRGRLQFHHVMAAGCKGTGAVGRHCLIVAMALKRNHDQFGETPSNQAADNLDIFESSSIEDRASTFVAAFSPNIAPRALQAHESYKEASHRILAWRKPSKQQSLSSVTGSKAAAKIIYDTGSDDDGEKYAGKKLEKLLAELDVTGAVVVARWYGGVLLGPVRFDHIVNVAREAIQKWQTFVSAGPSQKKLKVDATPSLTPEQEAQQKERLAKQLSDRDVSIKVLRELLAEKKTSKSQDDPTSDSPKPSQNAQTKVVPSTDYTSMPLIKLKQLEKARDTTISWILKQIDEAEAEPSKLQ